MERTIQKRIEVNDSWVTVDVYGEPAGPAIVLIPGVLADAGAWARVAQRLESWQTVVVVNRRGREPSGPLTSTYSLQTEVEDAAAVLDTLPNVRTLFGWSYGGLVALRLADTRAVPDLIAYEPVVRPFGAGALPQLRQAHEADDTDAIVETALRDVTGMDDGTIQALRADGALWAEMRRLSRPLYAETKAINDAPASLELARGAERIDLIVGERNRGRAPYGTSFDDVARRVPGATVHELDGQGHLAHLEAPDHLAALIERIAKTAD